MYLVENNEYEEKKFWCVYRKKKDKQFCKTCVKQAILL